MSRQKLSLLLLWRKERETLSTPLRQALTLAGYAVNDFCLEGKPTADQLVERLVPTTAAVLFCDADAGWIREMVPIVRTAQKSGRNLALLWGGSSAVSEQLFLDAGIDDFLLASDTPANLGLRVQLRAREAAARSATDNQLKEQAASLSKIETALKQREEFLSVCAHDLRSPLGLIQSSLTLLLNDPAAKNLTPMQEELVTRAKRQAGQAITLVGDLLDVMALEQGLKPRYQLLNLDSLLGDFYKDYRLASEQKQIQFHYDNLIPKWRVLGDADRVRQLLQNLFTNALKFTEPGRNIYLSVTPFSGRRKNDPPYPMMIISVKDEGLGIPENEMRRIFDRFTQVKKYSRGDGRGLGLTVAKQISTLHDGNIWVQSIEGKGSTFFVLFPHAISRLEAPTEGGGQRVLVVEPDELNREKYFEKLTEWGHEVFFAKDGVEAIMLLYHVWPSAVVLTSELAKIAPVDVANLLKADPLASKVPLIYAEGGKASEGNLLVDARVPLPFTRTQWDKALIEVQQRQLSTPLTKAA